MILLKIILKFLKIINSEAHPWQIALGFAAGTILGLTPIFSAHNVLIFLIILSFRINITSVFVSWGIFSTLALFTNPYSVRIGEALLLHTSFYSIGHFLSETPIIALCNLTNTIVLGSLLISLAISIPITILMIIIVRYYRNTLKQKVEKWKIVKILKASKLAKKIADIQSPT